MPNKNLRNDEKNKKKTYIFVVLAAFGFQVLKSANKSTKIVLKNLKTVEKIAIKFT